MKKSAFAAIFAIAAMVLSSLITPCRAQEMSMDRLEELQKNNVLPRAEQMPEFPGGMPALMEYLKEKIHYPKECRDAGIEGKAYIVFVVKKNGKIDEIEIARSTGNELLDKEALRVVKKMPKWKPGMHEGKKVNVLFALPITFKLR